ncbi:MAG: hypothetical protein AAGA28_13405 [Pseudomonadota bacterium]
MKAKVATLLLSVSLVVPSAGFSQSLKDGIEKGLSGVKEGVGKVGESAAGVAEKVGDTVDSTVDAMTNEPTPDETRAKLDSMAASTLERLFAEQPEARELFDTSEGYAVFDTRKVILVGFSGGAGRGVAVAPGDDRTYMNMGTAGVGVSFGLGGFETQVVILFEDRDGFDSFVVNGYDATAEAGTMFGENQDSAEFRFVDGRVVFFLTNRGWKVSASVAGTKYWADGSLN